MPVTIRPALIWCAAALVAAGCTRQVDGFALLPDFETPGVPAVVDVDGLMLGQERMRAITGAGDDLTIIPSMDGTTPVDIDALAQNVPPECRFIFAETQTFGPDVEGFHKTTFQNPPKGGLISEGAAAYHDADTARRAFDGLLATVQACSSGSFGSMLIGDWSTDADSLHIRPGDCGRDYRLKSVVLIEVTFCQFPETVPDIVITNIAAKVPDR